MKICSFAQIEPQNLRRMFASICISLGPLPISSCFQKEDSQILETRTFDIDASFLRFDENKEAKFVLNIKKHFNYRLETIGIEKSWSCLRIEATKT